MKKKTLWGKKLLSSAAVLALGVSLLAGCGSTDTPAATGGTTDSGKAASGEIKNKQHYLVSALYNAAKMNGA